MTTLSVSQKNTVCSSSARMSKESGPTEHTNKGFLSVVMDNTLLNTVKPKSFISSGGLEGKKKVINYL